MPLIRYSVGDIGQQMQEDCSCGRILPLMKVVEGRKDSFIKLANNEIVSPLRFYWIMNEFVGYAGIVQYRIIQKRIDLIHLLIQPSNGVDLKLLSEKLKSSIWKNLCLNDNELKIDVEFVEMLPHIKGGKLASVVSEVKLN